MGAQASSLIILMIEMEKILRGNWQQIWENLYIYMPSEDFYI